MEERNEKNGEGNNTESEGSDNRETDNLDSQSDESKVEITDNPASQDENSEPAGEANSDDKPEEVKEEPVSEPEVKEEAPAVPKSKKGKEGSWMPMIIVMGLSLVIAFSWDKVSFISDTVHKVLDPSAGWLLDWNTTAGMLIIVLAIGLLTTLIQKYATDQDALRELKKEQKILQAEMKKYKDDPGRVAELSKKQMQFIPKTMKLTSRAIMFTGVPFILFFRWFSDYFLKIPDFKFFGFLSWFWFYLIFTMVFSGFLRKWMKVV